MNSLPPSDLRSGWSSAQNHALLLLILLIVAISGRYLWSAYGPVPLSRLQFQEVVLANVEGVVVADTGFGLLVLKDGMLLWHHEGGSRVLARKFVNLLDAEHLYINTGTEVMSLSLKGAQGSAVKIAEQLQGAVLVSVCGPDCLHFYHQGQVWAQSQGRVEVVAGFDDNSVLSAVMRDWQQGVLFFDHQSWTVYSQYQEIEHVEISSFKGILAKAVLDPPATGVVFALERAGVVSVWHSRVDGSNMVQWLEEEMNYAALEVAWSKDGSQVLFTLIGSRQIDDQESEFTSVTAYARRGGEEIVELDRNTSNTVMAVVPTAWADDGNGVYIHRVFDEMPVPRLYRIQRR